MAMLPELTEVYPQLFTLIDLACKSWLFLSASQRMDGIIFWQGARDHMWEPASSQRGDVGNHWRETQEPAHNESLAGYLVFFGYEAGVFL